MWGVHSYSFRHFEKSCKIKATEMSSFLSLNNNLVTIWFNFLLASISGIISSNTINTFLSFVGL